MPEYLPENENPVNQAAKKALLKVGVKPEDDDLYLLQLMDWGLENHRVGFRVAQEEHREMYLSLRHHNPKGLMKMFLVNQGDPEDPVPSELLYLAESMVKSKKVKPVELAQEGWEQLAEWMSEKGLWQDSPVAGNSGL